jgi:hypothetical protein
MNMNEMLSMISRLRRERNVAISERKDALHALTGGENKWKAAVEMAARAEIERDEARELAHRFRSLYYTQLRIESSASWFPWEGAK